MGILQVVLPVLAASVSLGKCELPLLQVLLKETLPFPQKLLASSIACVYWLSSAETLLYLHLPLPLYIQNHSCPLCWLGKLARYFHEAVFPLTQEDSAICPSPLFPPHLLLNYKDFFFQNPKQFLDWVSHAPGGLELSM